MRILCMLLFTTQYFNSITQLQDSHPKHVIEKYEIQARIKEKVFDQIDLFSIRESSKIILNTLK